MAEIVNIYQLLSRFLSGFIYSVRAVFVFGMVDALLIMYSIDLVVFRNSTLVMAFYCKGLILRHSPIK